MFVDTSGESTITVISREKEMDDEHLRRYGSRAGEYGKIFVGRSDNSSASSRQICSSSRLKSRLLMLKSLTRVNREA